MSESTDVLEINTFAPTGDSPHVRLSLAGEIDLAARNRLTATVDWLIAQMPVRVLIDLADVTFAGSALPNFLTQACMALPDTVEVVVRDARPWTRWVLEATEMSKILTITDSGREQPTGNSR